MWKGDFLHLYKAGVRSLPLPVRKVAPAGPQLLCTQESDILQPVSQGLGYGAFWPVSSGVS